MHRVDPTEYAEKKRQALARAQALKTNRQNAVSEELTFKPKTNKRPGYLDALDKLKVEKAGPNKL